MTTEENIQISKKAYGDFQRGDIAAILAALDNNIEWNTPQSVGMSGAGAKKGHNQVADFFKGVAETWDFQAFDPKEYIASGDQVMVRGSYTARSKATGRTASAEWVHAWRFRNGKVTHFQEYTDSAVLRDALTARAGA